MWILIDFMIFKSKILLIRDIVSGIYFFVFNGRVDFGLVY